MYAWFIIPGVLDIVGSENVCSIKHNVIDRDLSRESKRKSSELIIRHAKRAVLQKGSKILFDRVKNVLKSQMCFNLKATTFLLFLAKTL